jgi:flavodoxin
MKTLVVFYSFSGNNTIVAEDLNSRLGGDIYEIKETKGRTAFTILFDLLLNRKPKIKVPSVSPDQYDRVILMAPMWNWKVASPMQSFIRLEKDHLKEYSFVTVCGGRTGQQEKLEKQLFLLAGKEAMLVVQLPVNNLVPPERRRELKNTASFRVESTDLKYFEPAMDGLVSELSEVITKQVSG